MGSRPGFETFSRTKDPNRSLVGLFFSLLIFSIAFLGNQGCKNQTPSSAAFVATSTPTLPPNVIDNLEDGDNYLNPAMCGVTRDGAPSGFWVASTWGPSSNVIDGMPGANVVFCGGVGANGTSCAIHIFGNITDALPTNYPSFQLEGKLRGGTYFDALQFGYTGVRFSLKTGVDDNCPTRRFNVGIGGTTPPSGGGYANSTNAYSHFGATLQSTGGDWALKTYPFSSLTRLFGTPLTPTTLTGVNLQQLLEVEWQFGRNGVPGASSVDYWVDEVQFF